MSNRISLTPARRGFTLIELLLVVAIIATLASVVIPMIGGSEKAAQISVESLSTNDAFKALLHYKIKNAAYPDYFDSLIASPGTTNYSKTSKGLFDSKFKLKTVALTDTAPGGLYLTSLKNAGIKNVMWHDELEAEPSVSGTIKHVLAVNDLVCQIDPATTNLDALRVLKETVPQGLGANQMTVILGIGLECRAIGTTLAAPPLSPRIEDFDKYRRYLAVFVANGDGTAATLKCVVNRHMDTVDHQLSNYVEEARK